VLLIHLCCLTGLLIIIVYLSIRLRNSNIKVEKFTSTNSRYATALQVLFEYGALDNDYQDEVSFQAWLEERLNAK